jgi:ABC-type multidrug transport system ATPase subunit/pSer/pThr/pTyr-binding forkhead associated (FHA) protein
MSDIQDHLLITKGPRVGEKVFLANLPMTIGREPSAEVMIDLESISRKHARISRVDGAYHIEDLGSKNGTFLNKERLGGPRRLVDGDEIALGRRLTMRVVIYEVQKGDSKAFSPSLDGAQAPKGDSTASMSSPAISNKTMEYQGMPLSSAVTPQLVINEPGQEPKIITLTVERLRIGRQEDNDIVLNNIFVSRHHAELEKRGHDYFIIPSPNVSNPLLLDGQPVMLATRLDHGARIRVGGSASSEMVVLDYISPADEGRQVIKFTENTDVTIGRDPGNTIVLPAPAVSRFHAEVEKVGQRYRLRDLRSSNGTFVNGKAVVGESWVYVGDEIQVGPYRFVVAEHEFAQSDQSEGVRVDVIGLNKWVNKSLNILQDIWLVFHPKEFVVVVGQSGGGKSTLVDAIAGYRPATHGRVMINKTLDVYKELDAIRSNIGYVPQRDIIHTELTVFQALNYAAQLRMPADTTEAERIQRVQEVMEDMDLAHRQDTQISRLSGGQQKRVSIGVELLTKPGLFFLDEPTSGLDPGMETELMRLMRRLADQGRTIVMITHATKNVMLADKVVFLARGGYLAWFGPPEKALAYFDQYRTERDRRASSMEFDHIYTLLGRDEIGSPKEWAERFRNDPAYSEYILERSTSDSKIREMQKIAPAASRPVAQRNQKSALRQFFILSARNVKILTRDWFSLFLLLATAPFMASLDFVLASGFGQDIFGFKNGNFNNVTVSLVVLTNTMMTVGGLSFIRELVKEREIYKRERMVNLKLSSYIMSKIWIALLLAVYQAVCYTLIRYAAFNMPGGIEELIFFFITVYLLVFSGMLLGLFASALAPNANSAQLLLVTLIIPQLVLSGVMVPLPAALRAPASSSWAVQGIIVASGAGSDVARDACWALPKEERDKLTLQQKDSNCICMGENALRESSCNFPGLGKYYNTAIDQNDPAKPMDPGPTPAQPVLGSKPVPPRDPNDLLAQQTYLNDLAVYDQEIAKLQDAYQAKMVVWQQAQQDYKDRLQSYQEALTQLEITRAVAVGAAESTIENYKNNFDWTFIDKKDRRHYLETIFLTWASQILIILVLFVGTVFMQKRRDVG